MTTLKCAVAHMLAAICISYSTVANAKLVAEYPSAPAAFDQFCLAGGLDPKARPIALTTAGWTQDEDAYVNLANLSTSGSTQSSIFSDPETVTYWSGKIDGQSAQIILASFIGKRRYPNLCVLVLNDVENAMPYADELRESFKKFGLGGTSVDLVHYFGFGGKIGADKRQVRGEIFSRSKIYGTSFVLGSLKNTHIYVAY